MGIVGVSAAPLVVLPVAVYQRQVVQPFRQLRRIHLRTGGFTEPVANMSQRGFVHRGEFVFTRRQPAGLAWQCLATRGYAPPVMPHCSLADSRSQASGTFEQNNHVVINNEGTNGQIGPQALKAVYDVAQAGNGCCDRADARWRSVLRRWTMIPSLESETRYGCGFGPSVRKVRFGDGYSQRAPAGAERRPKRTA